MEIFITIVTTLLSASGIFASTGALELIKKLWKQFRIEQGLQKIEPAAGGKESIGPKISSDESADDTALTLSHVDSYELARRGGAPRPARRTGSSQVGLFSAVLLVACVFGIAIGVIWSLTHIGGPVEAGVKTTIEKAGGSILIVGTGLFGAFFAVAILAFAAIHVFSKKSDD